MEHILLQLCWLLISTYTGSFNRFVSFNQQKLQILLFKKPNLSASFVLFINKFSSIAFTKCGAAILKFSDTVIIPSTKVIIGRYDAILKQSEHEYLYNQWSNDTNIWISWSSIKFSKPSPWAEVKIKLRRRKNKGS